MPLALSSELLSQPLRASHALTAHSSESNDPILLCIRGYRGAVSFFIIMKIILIVSPIDELSRFETSVVFYIKLVTNLLQFFIDKRRGKGIATTDY